MREKAQTGRLWAHLKHIEMKNFIRRIKAQEGSLNDENKTISEKVQEIMLEGRKKGAFGGSDIRVEDDFKLPFGFGFDEIIQQRADLVNSQKAKNNQIMDDLVINLGYLDYRDCLAANKYILEAKRHGDYHQNARAKTLALAMSRMTQLKRE